MHKIKKFNRFKFYSTNKIKKFNRYKFYSTNKINLNDENNIVHKVFTILEIDILSN